MVADLTPPLPYPFASYIMAMVYSMSSALHSRQIRWVGREMPSDRQFKYNETHVIMSSVDIAGMYGKMYHSDAIAALPNFTHED